MRSPQRIEIVVLLLLAAALPAYANNPPAPEGWLSLMLIFLVAVVATRLAGVQRKPEARWKRALRVFVLFLAALVAGGGTETALVPLIIILSYGVYRGLQIMHSGQGRKRFAIGLAVIVFSGLAIGDYMLSLNNWSSAWLESDAVGMLRELHQAETKFQQAATLDTNRNGTGEYGSVDQIAASGLFEKDRLTRYNARYQYHVLLTGDPTRDEKDFLIYALPLKYSAPPPSWSFMVPGGSYYLLRRGQALHYTRRSFVIDASGVVRGTDLGATRSSVTREEMARWTPVQ